ncbi:MAG: hypothetical protein HQL90_06940 [Magnetococcales bacterium]|nr:hypothetical protein [Magnetococcales bacterium]
MHSGRLIRQLLLLLLCWLLPMAAWGGSIHFTANAQLTAQSQRLTGQATLTLHGEESLANVQVWVYGAGEPQQLIHFPDWKPLQKQSLHFDLPTDHPWPGWYHLLMEIRFQDREGAWLNAALGVEYPFGAAVRSQVMPAVLLHDHQVAWPATPVPQLSLRTTTGPYWRLHHTPLTPADNRLELLPQAADTQPLLGWSYTQVAVLDWVEAGVHQSRIFEWRIQTDRFSPTWQAVQEGPALAGQVAGQEGLSGWPGLGSLGAVPAFLLGVLFTVLVGFFFYHCPCRKRSNHNRS